jgi:altered-inheritance-of-mitochondria protein 13
VVDHLSDRLASPETTFERQATIDARIRAQIQSELKALRSEEENVQREIQRALEKENLDREIGGVGGENAHRDIKNSSSLIGDLEEIRAKVDRFQTRNKLDDLRSVKETGEAVALCYRYSLLPFI